MLGRAGLIAVSCAVVLVASGGIGRAEIVLEAAWGGAVTPGAWTELRLRSDGGERLPATLTDSNGAEVNVPNQAGAAAWPFFNASGAAAAVRLPDGREPMLRLQPTRAPVFVLVAADLPLERLSDLRWSDRLIPMDADALPVSPLAYSVPSLLVMSPAGLRRLNQAQTHTLRTVSSACAPILLVVADEADAAAADLPCDGRLPAAVSVDRLAEALPKLLATGGLEMPRSTMLDRLASLEPGEGLRLVLWILVMGQGAVMVVLLLRPQFWRIAAIALAGVTLVAIVVLTTLPSRHEVVAWQRVTADESGLVRRRWAVSSPQRAWSIPIPATVMGLQIPDDATLSWQAGERPPIGTVTLPTTLGRVARITLDGPVTPADLAVEPIQRWHRDRTAWAHQPEPWLGLITGSTEPPFVLEALGETPPPSAQQWRLRELQP